MTKPFRKAIRGQAVRGELLPGQSQELLRLLGIVDRRGNVQADARRKLKQVNHLARLLEPALQDALERHPAPVLVDAAAGNAYLGFVLYDLYLRPAGRGELVVVEPRPDLAGRVRERAQGLGWERVRVLEAPLRTAPLPERVHALVALHACDTASDEALLRALAHRADHVAVIPCCQAELARQLQSLGDALPDPALRALWRHPWHRRELGSHLTNVIRALWLEAQGYQVTVTELTGWEHALKNELILGRRVGAPLARAQRELEALLERIPVRPALLAQALNAAPAPPPPTPEPPPGPPAPPPPPR